MKTLGPDYYTKPPVQDPLPLEGESRLFIPAANRQVGGDHYKTAIQPMYFAEVNGLTPCITRAIVYVFRHRSKNGKQDVLKASHCCELGAEFYEDAKRHLKANPPEEWAIIPGVFIEANKITGKEAAVILHLLSVYTVGVIGYLRAKDVIDKLVEEYH